MSDIAQAYARAALEAGDVSVLLCVFLVESSINKQTNTETQMSLKKRGPSGASASSRPFPLCKE